ncbi:hypothetical protein DMC25_12895 [Caulobacter sp. D4A]|uniref:hypothetical protein n=1 Tax=unclassified Caulobacter TaxID=2648921 RepID=UPI000D72F67D|nr:MULTISPECIES: hypothetical protein [unclassified Caulobacter]PXA87186.1 hypothetical protein DMC25_12895 [Caulobacter sp. D4A]PXA87634.1 hypothetical protein DMC18_20665 [Caulobacter sp. D5]
MAKAKVASALAGLGLLLLAAPSLAQAPAAQASGPLGVGGKWMLDLPRSHFNEALTGAAPLSGELDITKDDGKFIAWTLVEEDDEGVAAIQFADAGLDGSPTRAVVNFNFVTLSVDRTGQSSVAVMTHGQTGRRQTMRVALSAPDTLLIEQDVDGKPGPPDQTLIFVRKK